jgi:hypothetical protein
MAKLRNRRTMNEVIHRALEDTLAATTRHDERVATYLRDPSPGAVERDRHLAAIAAERDQSIAAAAAAIDRESEAIERDYRRHRRTNFDGFTVAEAWRRTERLLDAGLGLADIANDLESRAQAMAVRENARTYFTAALKGARRETVDQSVREILDLVDAAELPLIDDPVEQSATERELERRAGMRAVQAVAKFVRERQAGIPADAAALISLGLALSTEGFAPAPAPEDPGAVAERERNSLRPELRAALDANARDAGPRRPSGPIEVMR